MTTEPEEEDVDSGWDVGGAAQRQSASPPAAQRTATPAPMKTSVSSPAVPKMSDVRAAIRKLGQSGETAKFLADEGLGAHAPGATPPPMPAAQAASVPTPAAKPAPAPTAKPAATPAVQPPPAPAPGRKTTPAPPLAASPPPATVAAKPTKPPVKTELRPATSPTPSVPAPKARSFTPKVTNAVQQAKALDQEASVRRRRPTPMRVPVATPDLRSPPPPAPEVSAKPPTTSLRFTEKGPAEQADRSPPNQRKQTLKLNRATQDFALEMLNTDADVYSQRARSLGAPSEPEAAGERTSAPALELHLGDWGDAPAAPSATGDKPPTTARSVAPQRAESTASAPPRFERKGVAGLRTSGPSRDAGPMRKDITRLDTPSELSASAPTRPPPPGNTVTNLLTLDDGLDPVAGIAEVSLDVDDGSELSDAEAAELAALESSELSAMHEPASTSPISKEPETVRGGPDDDPILVPVKERFDRKDFMGALLRAEAILADKPDHAGAKFFATICQDRVKEMYVSRLGSGTSVPQLAMSTEAIVALALDHRSGFVISLIDGYATVDDILDISGMPMLEALRILFELKNEGIIDT